MNETKNETTPATIPAERLTELGRELEQARLEVTNAEAHVAQTEPRTDERRAALEAKETALSRMREAKEQIKAENMRRNFAGIGSPLHTAIVEQLSADAVTELERRAMDLFAQRERAAAERRAAKEATSAPAPSATTVAARQPSPEVYLRRPSTLPQDEVP